MITIMMNKMILSMGPSFRARLGRQEHKPQGSQSHRSRARCSTSYRAALCFRAVPQQESPRLNYDGVFANPWGRNQTWLRLKLTA